MDNSLAEASPPSPQNSTELSPSQQDPTTTSLSLQCKEKILCLRIMGSNYGKALSTSPSMLDTPLDSIHHSVVSFQSKGIHHSV